MAGIRSSQIPVELLTSQIQFLRSGQIAVEISEQNATTAEVRSSQIATEISEQNPGAGRSSQVVVEVLVPKVCP